MNDFAQCLFDTGSAGNAIPEATTIVIMTAADDDDFQLEVFGGIVSLALRAWLDYKRRVVDRYCKLPFDLLWMMCTSDVAVDCIHRHRMGHALETWWR